MVARRLSVLLIAVVVSCLACGQTSKRTLTPDQLMAKARESVFVLMCQTPKGPENAVGFLVGSDGLALAACDFMGQTISAKAKFSNGQVCSVTGVIDSNALSNMALIKISVSGRPPLSASAFPTNAGAKVYTLGSSNGTAITLFSNSIKQVRNGSRLKLLWIGGPTSAYNLGAPVLNTKGEVVAMLAYQHGNSDQTNTAVPITYLKNLNRSLAIKPLGQDVVASGSKSSHTKTSRSKSLPNLSGLEDLDLSDDDWQNSMDLTKAMVDASDCAYGICEQYVINVQPNGLSYGVDPDIYVSQDMMKTERSLLQGVTFENEKLEAARQAVVSRLTKLIDDSAQMVSLVTAAQLAGSWSDDALKTSESIQQDALSIQQDEGIRAFIKNKNFQDMFPKYYLELMGVIPAASGYRMGILSTSSDSLFVIWADPNQVAGKLKISNLDRILSIDGVKPKDMDDFKRMVKESEGRKVIIRVAPKFGDEYEYTVEVPTNLGE